MQDTVLKWHDAKLIKPELSKASYIIFIEEDGIREYFVAYWNAKEEVFWNDDCDFDDVTMWAILDTAIAVAPLFN